MKKILREKNQFLLELQNQTVHFLVQVHPLYHRLVILSYILKQAQTNMVMVYSLVFIERILFKSAQSLSIVVDSQQEVVNQWVYLESNFYSVITPGVLDKKKPKNDR